MNDGRTNVFFVRDLHSLLLIYRYVRYSIVLSDRYNLLAAVL